MKRFYLLVLAILVCTCAWAQLNVKSKSSGPESIATAASSKAGLIFQEKYGYLMMIVSSNRYDKSGYFLLGKDLDSAVQTLSDLLDLYGSIGDDQVTVEPWPERTCLLYASDRPGWMVFKFSQHAGHCEVWKKDLEMFLAALKERQAVKVEVVE